MKKHPTPEWSFLVPVEKLSAGTNHYKITANSDECADLAARFDILGLAHVSADLTLMREKGGARVHVAGVVRGDVTQACVVTLDPVTTHVEETFDAYFAEPGALVSFAAARNKIMAKSGEVEAEMVDEEDAPEPIIDGHIDVGEVAAQFLCLGLPLYPRSASAPAPRGDSPVELDVAEDAPETPFAALKDWKNNLT